MHRGELLGCAADADAESSIVGRARGVFVVVNLEPNLPVGLGRFRQEGIKRRNLRRAHVGQGFRERAHRALDRDAHGLRARSLRRIVPLEGEDQLDADVGDARTSVLRADLTGLRSAAAEVGVEVRRDVALEHVLAALAGVGGRVAERGIAECRRTELHADQRAGQRGSGRGSVAVANSNARRAEGATGVLRDVDRDRRLIAPRGRGERDRVHREHILISLDPNSHSSDLGEPQPQRGVVSDTVGLGAGQRLRVGGRRCGSGIVRPRGDDGGALHQRHLNAARAVTADAIADLVAGAHRRVGKRAQRHGAYVGSGAGLDVVGIARRGLVDRGEQVGSATRGPRAGSDIGSRCGALEGGERRRADAVGVVCRRVGVDEVRVVSGVRGESRRVERLGAGAADRLRAGPRRRCSGVILPGLDLRHAGLRARRGDNGVHRAVALICRRANRSRL